MLDKARVHPPLQKGRKKKEETITASEQNEWWRQEKNGGKNSCINVVLSGWRYTQWILTFGLDFNSGVATGVLPVVSKGNTRRQKT